MCVAVPGKVVSVGEKNARVEFDGNFMDVRVGLAEPNVGDYVLVHAGCAIEIMSEDKAREILDLFAEM